MLDPLSPNAIVANPDGVTHHFLFQNEQITLRVLRHDDAVRFGRYLEGLSKATALCFKPHLLTMEAARKLCEEIDYTQLLRLIALTGEEDVIAYFILTLGVRQGDIDRFRRYGIALDKKTDCVFAPSLADAYQNRGLGSILAARILDLARRLEYTRMILQGGTQKPNHRGIHFYQKLGFRKVGEFTSTAVRDGVSVTIENQDMLLVL